VILGEGPERPRLESLVADLDLDLEEDVMLPGFVSNPFAYMARSAVFVLSSKWEGLPGVLIQALACGCPVISTDCPSGPAEVLDNERYGSLVPVGGVESLARAIERTLDDPPPRELLKEGSRRYASDVVVRDYLEFFESKLR
jgi:glycosyltransferase involved in cell wall biosynthesis